MNTSTRRVLAALTLAFGAAVLSVTACPVSSRADAQEARQTLTVSQFYQGVEARNGRCLR